MPNLLDTYVVLGPDHAATSVPVTPTIWEELDRRFERFRGRVLVARFDFERDWPTWEMHPNGDEVVVLLSGVARMVLGRDEEQVTHLTEPGQFVVVPRGTWHTARVDAPTSMLFVTPGEGTANEPA
jgi:mannose-6-phosphate isomerase-like protein (cupin superfamily)